MGEVIVVSNIDKQIVLMKAEGLASKEICDRFNMNKDAIDKRLTRLREKFNCVSILHLYKTMKDQGYI